MMTQDKSLARRIRTHALDAFLLAFLASLVAGGCSKDERIQPESTSGGTGGGAAGSGGSGSNAAGSGGSGGTADADASTVPPSELACPSGLPGAQLVRIQTTDDVVYCMDQREVTWGEFKAFMAAKAGDASGQAAECSWNTSFEPKYHAWNDDTEIQGDECPAGTEHKSDDQAANCIDFCDALAYCEWAGKRLCGRVGGPNKWGRVDVGVDEQAGPIAPQWEALEDVAQSTAMEFGYGCTQAGKTTYAYGNAYDPGRCLDWEWVQTKGENAFEIADFSTRTCHGTESPFNQLYDLSGSVEEWQNLCGVTGGMSCLIIGGSWADTQPALYACAGSAKLGKGVVGRSPNVGFRCCTDGVPMSTEKP